MLREKEFRCRVCGNRWLQMCVVGEPVDAECCGLQAKELVGAPAVREKKPFRPTKADQYRMFEESEIGGVRPSFNPKNVEAIAEKTFSELRGSGHIHEDGSDRLPMPDSLRDRHAQ